MHQNDLNSMKEKKLVELPSGSFMASFVRKHEIKTLEHGGEGWYNVWWLLSRMTRAFLSHSTEKDSGKTEHCGFRKGCINKKSMSSNVRSRETAEDRTHEENSKCLFPLQRVFTQTSRAASVAQCHCQTWALHSNN